MCDTESSKPKILVVLTGGTICSSTDEKGERFSDAANVKIIDAFQKGASPFGGDAVDLEPKTPLDILSENMTVHTWNVLLEAFRQEDWSRYRGVIILHGTDTLAYTACLLSLVLAGVPVPVCMVSSQLPLDQEGTNGHANFRASVELIMNGIAPNVYAVYRNSDGVLYAHYGAHLLQSPNYSDDFFSPEAMVIPDPENACLPGRAFESDHRYLEQMGPLSACVLRLIPCVGLDYSVFGLDGIRAVVHGTYHSQSVCVQRSKGVGQYGDASILKFLDRCSQKGIPVFLAPCSPEAFRYESTGDAIRHGAAHIYGLTNEMAYVKTLLGCALGLEGAALQDFLETSINHETAY